MAELKLLDETVIGDNNKPYFVAEVNSSHGGDFNTAIKMIDAAKEAGCNCVKFQSWSSESLYSKSYYIENPIAKRLNLIPKLLPTPNSIDDNSVLLLLFSLFSPILTPIYGPKSIYKENFLN